VAVAVTATKRLKRRKPPQRRRDGPRPYTQRSARTCFLRVPGHDWPMVKRGFQRVLVGGGGKQSGFHSTRFPLPVVAFAIVRKEYDCRLMVLEDARLEMLGAIDPVEAGFANMAEFRRYWMARERTGRGFPPTRHAWVYSLRPLVEGDREEMALMIYDRLYGEFTDGFKAQLP
jgi:hypothetical protein